MKKVELENGVIAVTTLATSIDPNIGIYKGHMINGIFGFTVKLTKGEIEIPREVAINYVLQPKNVTFAKMLRILNTFKNGNT